MGHGKVTVRFAGVKDYNGLVALNEKKSERPLKRILAQNGPTKAVVALNEGKVVGRALLHIVPWLSGNKRAILADIFVAKDYRSKGIGTKLVDFCVREARKVANDIQIDRVDPKNKAAVNIYKKKFRKKQLVFGSF